MRAFGVMRPPRTILCGSGSVTAVAGLAKEHGRRILLCTDAGVAATPHLARVREALEQADLDVSLLTSVVPELPLSTVTEAIEDARPLDPECIVGLGGGSVLDFAKLVALGLTTSQPIDAFYGENRVLDPTLPVLALPTTAGTGSEVTPVAVLSDPALALKVGVSSPHLVPRAAICDPELTHGAPRHVTAYAGIDALAHAIEAYTAVRHGTWAETGGRVFVGQNVLSAPLALAATERLARNLPAALADDPAARAAALEGSLLAGLAFASAGTAGAHALQYPVGAATGTPHGLGTGLLLPYVMRFNRDVRATELAMLARAMGCPDATPDAAIDAVATLASDLGLPRSLAELGVTRANLDRFAAQAMSIERLVANNPRPLDRSGALLILEAAWHGELARVPTRP